ncbi:hypothetical protein P170DRAFT_314846, partial [Aspergillus steynii IBT 23096]
MSLPMEPQTWRKGHFTISTDKSLLSIAAINSAFDKDYIHWTYAFPDATLQSLINSSFCFGVYKVQVNDRTSSSTPNGDIAGSHGPTTTNEKAEQIGFARLVTDNVTFAYLNDLYILPEHQGLGLGGWLLEAIDELLRPLPRLRWFMLRTSGEKSRQLYEKKLGMAVLDACHNGGRAVMMGRKGRG